MIQLHRPCAGEQCYGACFFHLTGQRLDRQPRGGYVQHFCMNWDKSPPQDASWHPLGNRHVTPAVPMYVEGAPWIYAVHNLHSHNLNPRDGCLCPAHPHLDAPESCLNSPLLGKDDSSHSPRFHSVQSLSIRWLIQSCEVQKYVIMPIF